MQDVHENLYAEIMSMASVFERMDCHNSANYMRKRLDNGFLSGALRSLYSDARTVRFAGDITGLDQRLIGGMRKSAVSALDLLSDRIAAQPGKKAKYRQIGMMPYDIERAWFMNRFNADVERIRQKMPRPIDDPERYLRLVFKLYTSFMQNVHRPYAELYRTFMKNLLGSNCRDVGTLIEENFSMDSVFLVNGKAVSDIRWLRRMYREKRYTLKGDTVTFDGVDGMPKLTYTLWELMVIILFMQRKVLLLCSMFCLIDIEKIRQVAEAWTELPRKDSNYAANLNKVNSVRLRATI